MDKKRFVRFVMICKMSARRALTHLALVCPVPMAGFPYQVRDDALCGSFAFHGVVKHIDNTIFVIMLKC